MVNFAENYSFQVQVAIQGYHWENSQATLHTVVVYTKRAGEVKPQSFCFISDSTKHSTNTVHAFLTRLLKHMIFENPNLKNIEYFSDGAASQYKNFKNFANLANHFKDFNIKARWNFFATSHGKSPCDGIGGVIKRLVARASLQAASEDQILTPLQMFDWCNRNIKNIMFFYLSNGMIEDHIESFQLEERYAKYNKIVGTRTYHYFEPVGVGKMKVKNFSDDSDSLSVVVNLLDTENMALNFRDLQIGNYVMCKYDKNWYVGVILDTNEEEEDFKIKFMVYSYRNRLFTWPNREDQCWIPLRDMLAIIQNPILQGLQ